ncbi:hypothetical protein [Pseudomonas indica]|uniref:hypothetical protein n=1 Tax=Pseudomonas indica TaxID=137658 RepID=UPI000BD737D9|nr:hypothetical protein [Pseudomonas indica]PAU60833.1 hypothetical protein BZL42_09680 [Pseudomonas indica]
MDKIAERLQRHPMVVLVMFVLSALSALMTIVLGWDVFYESFLSKEMSFPVWLIILVVFFGAIIYVFSRGRFPLAPKQLETVEGKQFGVQQIEVDGKNFVNCTFDGSELVFRGLNGFSLQKNNFVTPPRITFQDYAGNTIWVMRALYKDPAFRTYVERTFE